MLDEINIVWFKRDLRITDHLPIYRASIESLPFIPLYVLDQNYWSQGFSSIRHWNFVYDCLEELNDELTKIGQPLIIKNGSAAEVFKNIQSIFKIKKVYTHEETSNDWVRKENLSVKIKDTTLVGLETSAKDKIEIPEKFNLFQKKIYGKTIKIYMI